MEPQFTRVDAITPFELAPGISGRPLFGEGAMLNVIEFEPGSVVPLHSHFDEQVTHIQSGALHFTINGQEITVRPGEFLCIPPNVPHTAVALEDTLDIDIFTPPRADWINKTDQYLRG